MWFAFGIISLLTFTVYFGRKRYLSHWEGTPGNVAGLKYRHHTTVNKDKLLFIQIGCSSDAGLDLSIKAETSLDRFFKFLGVSVEHQVGRDAFDEKLYIINDHSTVCEILSRSQSIQNEITKLV